MNKTHVKTNDVPEYDEQFVQDAVCVPENTRFILELLGYRDWAAYPLPDGDDDTNDFDVVNQEVNIGSGRIDVLATFNRRTRFMLAEIKLGDAGPEALSQLKSYLKGPLEQLGIERPAAESFLGILVAERFVGIQEESGIRFVCFDWRLRESFRLPEPITSSLDSLEESPPRQKWSQLRDFERHHVQWLCDDSLRTAFRQVARCFFDESDPNGKWVVKNAKGQHVAVHYKGRYIAHLWAQKNKFGLGYENRTEFLTITNENWPELSTQIREDFRQLCASRDQALKGVAAFF